MKHFDMIKLMSSYIKNGNQDMYGAFIKRLYNWKFTRFAICGVITTGLDFLVYSLLRVPFGLYWSKITSTSIAMIVSFFLNRTFTFQNNKKLSLKLFSRFFIVQIANIIVNATINYVIVSVTHHIIIAFVFATGVAMILNFVLQKKWVFREEQK